MNACTTDMALIKNTDRKQKAESVPLNIAFTSPSFNGVRGYLVNTGKWLGRPVNIKEANKQDKIYVGRSLTLYIF